MTHLNLSKGSFYIIALFIKRGNKHVPWHEVSNAVLGIIALIGNDTLVKFKLPVRIFFPIYLTISLPTPLSFDITYLSLQILPPFLCPNS